MTPGRPVLPRLTALILPGMLALSACAPVPVAEAPAPVPVVRVLASDSQL